MNQNLLHIFTKNYGITPSSISNPSLVFTKFTKQTNHFIINSGKKAYFIKKIPKSNLDKLRKEIRAISKVKDSINVPKIIKTKDGSDYFIDKNYIFITHELIKGKNLKEARTSQISYFDSMCKIKQKLIQISPLSQSPYSFHLRINTFEKNVNSISEKLKNDHTKDGWNSKNYLTFLTKEVAITKLIIQKLKLRRSFIHGDLLMQNIIKDKKGRIWVVDWEKARDYVASVDILKSVIFTLLNPAKKDLGLQVNAIVKWTAYCAKRIPLDKNELLNIFDIYYFNFITGIDFMEKIYVKKQNLDMKMLREDFLISKWLKKHKNELQEKLNSTVE